jgi:hypothetical protein
MATQRMQVDDTTFLIDRLGADCAPLQFLRELTSNSIQAIQARRERTAWSGEGRIVWDVDWELVAELEAYKLRISDNGTGMTGPEIEQYINQLSSSGRERGLDKNYGLGAKIAGCVASPAGMLYRSWVDGSGVMATLWRDPVAGYGLEQIPLGGGVFAHHAAIVDEAKSDPIDTCGTAVTLLGQDRKQDNTFMPVGAKNKWLIKYLNDRYFEFPPGITVKVRNFQRTEREGWPESPEQKMGPEGGSQMKTIEGMKEHLKRKATHSGTVALGSAIAHWWILPEEGVEQRDIWESSGHCAALFQGELYNFQRLHAARSRLREFGVVFGTSRVVLYVEPDAAKLKVIPNTSRSDLLVDGRALPWESWAAEFRAMMPDAIKAMMDEITSKAGETDHSEAIRKRLREINDLLRITRYRPNRSGPVQVDGALPGGRQGRRSGDSGEGGSAGTEGASQGNLYGAFLKAGGIDATPVGSRDSVPKVVWISTSTDKDDDLEDRAALFDDGTNLIKVNRDFRIFADLHRYCAGKYNPTDDPNVAQKIRSVVEEWIELQLVEAVVGVRSLQGSKEWDSTHMKAALSPEALTAAVLPRYNLLGTINRALSAKFGKQTVETS